jgi:hypothetical protein
MSAVVRLKDIVDALEMQSDEYPSFLDLDTGEVHTVSVDLIHDADAAGDDEDTEDEDEEWKIAKRIAFLDGFLKLPTKFEVHEWNIMEEFSDSVRRERVREELLDAIHGPGAFRSFKSAIRRHNIEQDWYKFRTEALRQIAIDWCEEHHIAWE